MGFNSGFKGLNRLDFVAFQYTVASRPDTTMAEADFFFCIFTLLNSAQLIFIRGGETL